MEQTSTNEIGSEPIVQEVSQESPVESVSKETLNDMKDPDLEESVLDKEIKTFVNNREDRSVEENRDYSVSEDGTVKLITKHMLEDYDSITKDIYKYVDMSGDGFKTFSTLLKHNESKAEIISKAYGFKNRWEMMSFFSEISSMSPELARERVIDEFSIGVSPQEENYKAPSYSVTQLKAAVYEYSKKNDIPESLISNSREFVENYKMLVSNGLGLKAAVETSVKLSNIKYVKPEDVVKPVNTASVSQEDNQTEAEKAFYRDLINKYK